ncbi:Ohr family peroxiredoxin [Pseudoduganella sp. LjRoot289]|uniref:Ohr family peroxiredoxin n=1 Tax=Pseudoduganella sp. LjRoot289 TaxID=3342314 RepID=UPI003ED16D6D
MKPLAPPPLSLLDKYTGQEIEPLYMTTVKVVGGEAGHGRASGVARSDDGNLDLPLRLPVELGGPGGGTNPEQLFAAGFAACFHGVVSLLAAKANLSAAGATVEATVSFARDPVDGMYLLTSVLKVCLPGLQQARAEELVRNAERVCPYAKMAREGMLNVVTLV